MAAARDRRQRLLPDGVVEAPKRPLQTPQREWLRGPLREWATKRIEAALDRFGGSWLDADAVRRSLAPVRRRRVATTAFYVWQWISLGLHDVLFDPRHRATTGARGVV